MSLPTQRLCNAIDMINLGIPISLDPGSQAVIMWGFNPSNYARSNFLVLSLVDDAGNAQHFRVADWKGSTVEYRLQNDSGAPQSWFLTGWEVSAYDGGSGDCPKSQDGMRSGAPGRTEFFSRTPYYDGAGVHPGDTLVTVVIS